VFFVLFTASALFGQTNATLRGLITDQSGAILPGVAITVRNQQTGVERMSLSDETGNYQVAALPVGVYRVEVILPGMKPQNLTGLSLEVGQTVVHHFKLEVGAVAEEVNVSAEASVVDTATITVGEVVTPRVVAEMPLNGRHFLDLGMLAPGSV